MYVYIILYALIGLACLALSTGLVYRRWWESVDEFSRPSVRMAMILLAAGFLGLAMYNWYRYEAIQVQRMQYLNEQKEPSQE